MAKKYYNNKKLTDITNYTNYGDLFRSGVSWWKIGRVLLVLVCIGGVLWAGRWAASALLPTFDMLADTTTTVVSQRIGTAPAWDEYGSLNILLMGYGGADHQGGFLTDSLMVASFHPDNGTVILISIPRDLWVTTDRYQGKINSLFPHAMLTTGYTNQTLTQALDRSAHETIEKVEEITGLEIPYYALISFAGFQNFVDALGGVTVDVPERLVDREFPDSNMKGYDPLMVEPGLQIMDGALALKYARSRKSTSDFSRSYRQQQILASIIAQVQGSISITNISTIENLYNRYRDMVHTNITLMNMLYLSQYKDTISNFVSHVLTYECGTYFTQMVPGCLLTTPPRDRFGGASVLTPATVTPNNLNNYDQIRDFIHLMVRYPNLTTDISDITIYNAISREASVANNITRSGRANDVASKLVQYGFSISDIFNAEDARPRTIAYIYGTGEYSDTIDALRLFMDVDIYTGEVLTGHVYQNAIELYLGDNFLDDFMSSTNRFWNH